MSVLACMAELQFSLITEQIWDNGMPKRRKCASDSVVDVFYTLFTITPWWVCVVTAGLFFVILFIVVPMAFESDPLLKNFAPVMRLTSPIIPLLILLVGLFANLRKMTTNKLIEDGLGSESVNSMTWKEFEELLAAVYRRQGYNVSEVGSDGPDGGVDLILFGHNETVGVQCKHWRSDKVGVKLVRELNGIVRAKNSTADRGIFVTSGDFTDDAKAFAYDNDIELVDGRRLLIMLESARKNPSSNSHPGEVSAAGSPMNVKPPACPLCRSEMVLKTAQRGKMAGNDFWGCSKFPKCHGARSHNRHSAKPANERRAA